MVVPIQPVVSVQFVAQFKLCRSILFGRSLLIGSFLIGSFLIGSNPFVVSVALFINPIPTERGIYVLPTCARHVMFVRAVS